MLSIHEHKAKALRRDLCKRDRMACLAHDYAILINFGHIDGKSHG
jgi:hypothetical protein